MTDMFSKIIDHPNDPIESLYLRSQADTRPNVLNLGIGVYRDEQGKVPIFECVKQAEQRIINKSTTKGYMTPLGNQTYITASEKLIFAQEHPVLTEKRIISAQCPGAGAGLRLGAELTKSINPEARVYLSNPVWEHQIEFFAHAGLPVKRYDYYDKKQNRLDFQAMINSLEELKAGDLVVIHGCCHNPTGADLDLEQWQQLTHFLIEKQAIPFVDIAYQGYGTSIEEDVKGMQYMASKVDNMLVTLSSSKSFALYRDRAGLVSVIHSKQHPDQDSLKRYLRDIIRGTYFMPPDHAAAVIAEILNDNDLERSWRSEIDGIRQRIQKCRNALASAIESVDPDRPAHHLRKEKGMFSCFSLNSDQLDTLEKQHGIYLLPCGEKIDRARINFAAMSESHAQRIAESLCSL